LWRKFKSSTASASRGRVSSVGISALSAKSEPGPGQFFLMEGITVINDKSEPRMRQLPVVKGSSVIYD
jgi:hypothetical protein